MLSVVRLSSMLFIVTAAILTNSQAVAATQTVFGPKTYSPEIRRPHDSTSQFTSSVSAGTIKVINGDGKDIVIPICSGNTLKKLLCELSNLVTKAEVLLTRPSTFSVEINGVVAVSQSNLPSTKGSIEVPVSLNATNSIRVRVAGSSLSKIKIEVSAPVESTNQAPIASMQLSAGQGFAPLTITANGVSSNDPDGDIVEFLWDFGDGFSSTGIVASHVYTTPGIYSVRLTVKDDNGATNSQTKQVNVLQNLLPTADLRLVSSGAGLAPLIVIFDGSRSKDPENGLLRYFWNFGDGSPQFEGRASETHEFLNLGSYSVVLKVRDENGGEAQSSVVVQVNAPVLPPSPETMAPSIADKAYPTFEDKISFLYSGANPIQTGVNASAIDPKRLSVIRGKVLDADGRPLSGATLKILNEGDFGQTLSRADGAFDLAFNSGDFVTLTYNKNGYAPAQRKVVVTGQDYYTVEDVRLVPLDSKVTPVTLGAADSQVARANLVSDGSGDRTGTLIFPPQTQATLVMPDGSTKIVPELKIRVTEYTVGEDGPKKMPASLPVQTAYTYAMSITADEAIAMGSQSIKFNKPVAYYVENFLNFPIGVAVPVGAYDAAAGFWKAEKDGIVIKILGRNQGLAQVDLGEGRAANSVELAQLNFDESELRKLASTYADGVSLWRMQTSHFSEFDMNPPRRPRDIDNDSELDGETPAKIPGCPEKGCIINVESKVLGEVLEVAGVNFKLHYTTDRVPGKKTGGVVSGILTGKVLPENIKRIEVMISIAGRLVVQTYEPEINLPFSYQWDGYDAYGRIPQDTVLAKVKVRFVYQEGYQLGRYNGGSSFGSLAPVTANQTVPGRGEHSFDSEFSIPLKASQKIESAAARSVANGWFVSNHHIYDVNQNALFLGDGRNLFLTQKPWVYNVIAGGGTAGFSGDGGQARFAKFNGPTAAVKTDDGSIYISDKGNNRIRKIDPNGVVSSIAGNGMEGFGGDGGPAEDAILNKPHSIKVNRDGTFYIVDTGNNCIRFVDERGTITTSPGFVGKQALLPEQKANRF